MKRIMIMVLMLALLPSVSYGAVSEDRDVYVRREVFDVHMQMLSGKMDMVLQRLDALDKRMDQQDKDINELARATASLSGRVDGIDARMGDLRNGIYLWLVVLGIIVSLPTVQKFLQVREERRQFTTIEDVKRLIAEHEAQARVRGV